MQGFIGYMKSWKDILAKWKMLKNLMVLIYIKYHILRNSNFQKHQSNQDSQKLACMLASHLSITAVMICTCLVYFVFWPLKEQCGRKKLL